MRLILLSLVLAAAAPDAAPARIQLHPDALALPPAPPGATAPEGAFVAAASLAVEETYRLDRPDVPRLDSLQARLAEEPALGGLARTWGPILAAARARASSLELLGPGLVALQEAAAGARLRGDGSLAGMGRRACGRAFGHTALTHPAAQSFSVRAGSLGHRPVRAWWDACREARLAELVPRELGGRRAPARLEAWAATAPRLARLAGGRVVRLHRLAAPGRWLAGVVREAPPGEEPCQMVRLAGQPFRQAGWRRLSAPVPLLCHKMLVPARFR